MDKNSVIGFILIFLIFIGFSFYESNRAMKYAELQAQADSIALAQNPILPEEQIDLQSAAQASAHTADVYRDSLLQQAFSAESSLVALENGKVRVTLTTQGAQPYAVQVKDYTNYGGSDLYLFKNGGAEYNVSVYAGQYISTKDFVFEVVEASDSVVVMRLPFSGGGYIEQKYTLLADSYRMNNELSFVGLQGVIPRNVSAVDVDFSVAMPRMEKGFKNETQYSRLNYYFDGEKKPETIGNGRNGTRRIESSLSWFAFQQQFFSVIMRAPQEFSSGELGIQFYGEDDPSHNLMDCKANMRVELASNADTTIPFEFYMGPNHYQTLRSYGQKYEKIIPLGGWLVGWFTRFVIIPLFDFFGGFINSFGIVILLMTLVIKLVVFPLNYKSLASSVKMNALKPEIDKINQKYPHADNQQEQLKKSQATMELYRKAGVSPMGGCLPMLLTFPILWAMFRFFPASIELRQQSFLWCDDLSSYDSIVDFGFRIPLLGDHISLFALLMAVTMWAYSKFTMTSTGNDPNAVSMRFMSLYMMPIMMFFICNNLSAALSYYYLLSQLISILQMLIIRKTIKPEKVLAKVHSYDGKPMPKSKWQQRLEEAQKLQEAQLREQQKKQQRRR